VILNDLARVDWTSFAQPPWNQPGDVPSAVEALAATQDADDFGAYHRFLFAIGNSHAGTFFPVVEPTIPFLMDILANGPPAARLRTLDVLVDLLGSFEPERGSESLTSPEGTRSVRTAILQAVRRRFGIVERRMSLSDSPTEQGLLRELLGLIEHD
jgi:hypothetical protein